MDSSGDDGLRRARTQSVGDSDILATIVGAGAGAGATRSGSTSAQRDGARGDSSGRRVHRSRIDHDSRGGNRSCRVQGSGVEELASMESLVVGLTTGSQNGEKSDGKLAFELHFECMAQ